MYHACIPLCAYTYIYTKVHITQYTKVHITENSTDKYKFYIYICKLEIFTNSSNLFSLMYSYLPDINIHMCIYLKTVLRESYF